MNDLKEKNIIVTGASGGIGSSIVKKFLSKDKAMFKARSNSYAIWLILPSSITGRERCVSGVSIGGGTRLE